MLRPPAVGGGMKEESPARWAAGAAAPAPASRRRENLRSASFRDYAMAGVTPAPTVKAALRCRARALPRARLFPIHITGLPCQRVLILASRANGQGVSRAEPCTQC